MALLVQPASGVHFANQRGHDVGTVLGAVRRHNNHVIKPMITCGKYVAAFHTTVAARASITVMGPSTPP
jgi:hypothetical protein